MDGKRPKRIEIIKIVIRCIFKRCHIRKEAVRVAALVLSLILIFTGASGIVYPSLRQEDNRTQSSAEGDATSGAAVEADSDSPAVSEGGKTPAKIDELKIKVLTASS